MIINSNVGGKSVIIDGSVTTSKLADSSITWAKIAPDARPIWDNVLDNAYFLGGGSQQGGDKLPINQRGVTGTITKPGFFIDRWYLISGSVTITENGLVLNGTIGQMVERSLGQPFTASALRSDGVVPASYDDTTRLFTLNATGETVYAAKLELRSHSTIARQDGDSWILNAPPPRFADELLRCLRHQVASDWALNWMTGVGYSTGTTDANAFFFLPVPMRTAPELSSQDGKNWSVICNGQYITPTKIKKWSAGHNCILTKLDGYFPGNGLPLIIKPNSGTKVIFDANEWGA